MGEKELAIGEDPARAIWGDAVVDAAIAFDDAIAAGDAAYINGSGWHHAAGIVTDLANDDYYTTRGMFTGRTVQGTPKTGGNCCIVGHLNWLAAEQAGHDPAALNIKAWPRDGMTAYGDLRAVCPDAPNTLVIPTQRGKIKRSVAGILSEMINAHDRAGDAQGERRTMSWYGRRFYNRVVGWYGHEPAQPQEDQQVTPVTPPETVPVEERVPVMVTQ